MSEELEKEYKEFQKKYFTQVFFERICRQLGKYDSWIKEHPDEGISTQDLARCLKLMLRTYNRTYHNVHETTGEFLMRILLDFGRRLNMFWCEASENGYMDKYLEVESDFNSLFDSYIEKYQ